MGRWLRKVKRRKAGIYLARTRKHLRPWRRENGYVGRSSNVPIRKSQHLGKDSRHPAKPWTDLDPAWLVLWLPWWLSWRWVQAPLEWLAIKVCLPRYNDTMNHGNPRRVPISVQHTQRRVRDAARAGNPVRYAAQVQLATLGRRSLQFTGVLVILAGVVMTVWSNR